MASHSNWAQHIAFTTTEARFHDMSQTYLLEVPPSTTYNIKQGLSDLAPKETFYTKASAFGGKDDRFKAHKTNYQAASGIARWCPEISKQMWRIEIAQYRRLAAAMEEIDDRVTVFVAVLKLVWKY